MGNPMTDRASPAELANLGQVFDLKEDLSSFERLASIVEDDFRTHCAVEAPANWRQSPVAIRLRFEWSDVRQEIPTAEGHVSVRVPAVCQRCLEVFDLTLAVTLKLLFAERSDGLAAGEQYEVWELDEDTVRPLDIVEEALIMGMPLAAVHDAGTKCGALDEDEGPASSEVVRPFAELKSLMRDGEQ